MKTKKVTALLLTVVIVVVMITGCDSNKKSYEEAEALFNSGQYSLAADAFRALGDYKDAYERSIQAGFASRGMFIEENVNEVLFEFYSRVYEDTSFLELCSPMINENEVCEVANNLLIAMETSFSTALVITGEWDSSVFLETTGNTLVINENESFIGYLVLDVSGGIGNGYVIILYNSDTGKYLITDIGYYSINN